MKKTFIKNCPNPFDFFPSQAEIGVAQQSLFRFHTIQITLGFVSKLKCHGPKASENVVPRGVRNNFTKYVEAGQQSERLSQPLEARDLSFAAKRGISG